MTGDSTLDKGVPPLYPQPREGETITVSYDPYDDDYADQDDLTCTACGGSGVDTWEGFMPCEECDGEGYRWWE